MGAAELAARLPEIATLRRWSQSLALLDAILEREWQYRYFSFDGGWGQDEQMASMRDGFGNGYSITFGPVGAYVRGFDHESPLSPFLRTPPAPWPGLLERLPPDLRPYADEPAFTFDGVPEVTVCLWRLRESTNWDHGTPIDPPAQDGDPDIDGADWLFEELDGNPETYRVFAEWYHEVPVDIAAVRHVFDWSPLTEDVVRTLNPSLSLSALANDLQSSEYPCALG
jgi:hypothetical protein